MSRLASDERPLIRMAAAGNPILPVNQMVELACDEDKHVREALLNNPALPTQVLLKLASDEDKYVRRTLTEHPSLPAEVLLQLALNEGEEACYALTLPNVLLKLACDEDNDVKKALIMDPLLTATVRNELSSDEMPYIGDRSVRMSLINHPAIPPQLLLLLALIDKDSEVREAARSLAQAKPNIFWQNEVKIMMSKNVIHEALLFAKTSTFKTIFNSLFIAKNVIHSVCHLLRSNLHQDSNGVY